MPTVHGLRAKLRYRFDEFLASGAGRQLLLLFILSMAIVIVHVLLAMALSLRTGDGFFGKLWFYFTRILDAGTLAGDQGTLVRAVSIVDTVLGVVVAGLLISSLAGNFQRRLDSIRQGGSPVVERGHFLILGWSEKIFSLIDQLVEANLHRGRIKVVVMAEREKQEMEQKLAVKVQKRDLVKLVCRTGSSVRIDDLSKVALERAQAVVILVDENDLDDPNRADGRVIKTLLAIYHHPTAHHVERVQVTAEVMLPQNREIAEIASDHHASVVKTNEIISKILVQTALISGLSIVYDELLRFEGNEIHYARFPQVVGRRFGDLVLDFPNGCLVGVAKSDGSSHQLNPPADHVVEPDEELLILALDDRIEHRPYDGPHANARLRPPSPFGGKRVENVLILGWNEKIFPIIQEFDSYVAPGSTLTLVNSLDAEARRAQVAAECGEPQNVTVRHTVGEFTSRPLMERIAPHGFPTVMVLGDSHGDAERAEASDTRAIIALLLLRDLQARHAVNDQKVCSEILEPKNRQLAATTEIHDIVISNETVSMVLAQITHEPRVRIVLEDLFSSEGSEVYLKDLGLYVPFGQPVCFEELLLAARARGELAMGVQIASDDAARRFGIMLNPVDRRTPFSPKPGDRLIVIAEEDG